MELVILGIDGTGKSTTSHRIISELSHDQLNVRVVPFHKWLFAGYLRDKFGGVVDHDRLDRNSPYSPRRNSISSWVKPPIAFIDNILFYLLNKSVKKSELVIFDRFIVATQIKFSALGYRVNWFRLLWMNTSPRNAVVLIVDIEDSLRRQELRGDPYLYTREQLEHEQMLYVTYAERHGFPIINTSEHSPNEVYVEVKNYLAEKGLLANRP